MAVGKKLLYPLESCIFFGGHDHSWFQPLLSDALYLHAIAFTTHAYFNLFGGRSSPELRREPERHFLKALGLLRQRLTDEGENAISDPTLVVVLSLSMHALMMGDLVSARNHLRGLHKMFGLRGGIPALKDRPKLLIESFRHVHIDPMALLGPLCPTNRSAGVMSLWHSPPVQSQYSSMIRSGNHCSRIPDLNCSTFRRGTSTLPCHLLQSLATTLTKTSKKRGNLCEYSVHR